MKLVPKGYSDYKIICENNFYYIDKTLLIHDVLQNGSTLLYTRPRRFGKTLNMSMLKTFFEKTPEDKTSYFQDKKVWQDEDCRKHFSKYPVIFLTFKDCKETSCTKMKDIIKENILREYIKHSYIKSILNNEELKRFDKIINKDIDDHLFLYSLLDLSSYLKRYYKENTIIILDEYDTPVIQSFLYDYYDEFITFYATLLSTVLKDNPHLFKGILTGITRVAKESIFSGLNNFTSDSMIFASSFDKFGITEDELKEALKYYKIEDKFLDAEKWYNGYQINDVKLYNPFSIIDFLREKGRIGLYWLNTSSNEFIIKLIRDNFEDAKENLILLGEGKSIEMEISDNVVFRNLKNNESSLFSILFYSGYLKADKVLNPLTGNSMISIPNQEILMCYQKVFGSLLNSSTSSLVVPHILKHLLNEDYLLFHESLYDALLQTASIFDITPKENENFYHALFLGLILHLREGEYLVKSNREAGLERADLMILPRNKDKTGFIVEFKKVNNPSTLEKKAKEGLLQIQEKEYISIFEEYNIKKGAFLSIAFCGKNFHLLTHHESINESLKIRNQKSNPQSSSLKKSLQLTKEENVAVNLMKSGVPLEIISSSTGISLERLNEILEESIKKGESIENLT